MEEQTYFIKLNGVIVADTDKGLAHAQEMASDELHEANLIDYNLETTITIEGAICGLCGVFNNIIELDYDEIIQESVI